MNLSALPKLRDSISYLYFEHANIEQDDSAIVVIQGDSRIAVPISTVTCIMLGPGTSITHAAIKSCSENGCMIAWCGENCQRFYAAGLGETRSAVNILTQAKYCMDSDLHLDVAKKMYIQRFGSAVASKEYTLQQLRGMEGLRMRAIYEAMSKATGVKWSGRDYKFNEWNEQSPINKALSEANTLLYAVCHAAVVSMGYSPALGFIHTGKVLSFVYDIADLYKADTTIPAAFYAVKDNGNVRTWCRSMFEKARLLKRIPADIENLFDKHDDENQECRMAGDLWEENGTVPGGTSYAGDNEWF